MKESQYNEPWMECLDEGYENDILMSDGRTVVNVIMSDSIDGESDRFAIDRIVECINAMAGIEDPKGFVRAVVAAHLAWCAHEDGDCGTSELDSAMLKLTGHSEPLTWRDELKAV